MLIRGFFEKGLAVILEELEKWTIPVADRETIAQVAESVCFDEALSQILGEIFDILGIYGQIDVRSGQTREITREYVGGTSFEGGLQSQMVVNAPETARVQLENPAIFLSDLELGEPEDVIPIVRLAAEAGMPGLVVISQTISDRALGVLMMAGRNPQRFRTLAVKIPGAKVSEQSAYLEDLAILTGGKAFLKITADSARNVQLEDLGQARRVWADKNFLSVICGQGNPTKIRQHIAHLKGRYETVDDPEIRKLTLSRLGKFMGGSASLFVGGLSEVDLNARKELTRWAIGSVRGALLKGVLPGGGAALLACKPALDKMAGESTSLEERVAYQVLSRALESPARTILSNAGYDPGVYLARVIETGPGYGFDVRKGQITDMVKGGVFDSAGVLLEAVRGAVSSAALALTVDVMVHKKRQKMANQP